MGNDRDEDGCARVAAYAMIGCFLGAPCGFAIAVLQTPQGDPTKPLANEWYTLAIAFSSFCGAAGGGVLGLAVIAFAGTGFGWQSCGLGILGATIGAVAATFMPSLPSEQSAYRSVLVATIVAGAMILIVRAVQRIRQRA
jgi:MFS family permease